MSQCESFGVIDNAFNLHHQQWWMHADLHDDHHPSSQNPNSQMLSTPDKPSQMSVYFYIGVPYQDIE